MKTNSIFMMLAIAALVLATINASLVIVKTPIFKKLTGYASGYVNVTVNTQVSINMSMDMINWSGGTVTAGESNATLYTSNAEGSTVLRGNWTTSPSALAVANIGNINATLSLETGKNAAGFFGGTNPQYMWNITNKDPSSCNGATEGLNAWKNVNVTTLGGAGIYCTQFGYLTAANEIYINVWVSIPLDATKTGVQSDTLTVTGSTAPA